MAITINITRIFWFLEQKQAVEPSVLEDLDGRTAAAAALLVEAALRDGLFPEDERACVLGALTAKYGLTAAQAEACLSLALDSHGRLHGISGHLTTVVCGMDEAAKLALLEAMWEVACADGHVTTGEVSLIRRVAALIGISHARCGEAHELVLARKSA
jgi:uncharacterized tellurite resistance protein B-like protein